MRLCFVGICEVNALDDAFVRRLFETLRKKEERTMSRNRFKRLVVTLSFLVLLATLVLLSGCGGYNSPGSPKGTPTPGYGFTLHLDKEILLLMAPQIR
jgi:hypothetical protein